MRSLDQIYWDCECTGECGCQSLTEALAKHPRLRLIRDGLTDERIAAMTHAEYMALLESAESDEQRALIRETRWRVEFSPAPAPRCFSDYTIFVSEVDPQPKTVTDGQLRGQE